MAGRYRRARIGETVRVLGIPVPFTFWPDSYVQHGRFITSDPWSCLQVQVRRKVQDAGRRRRALAFFEQAADFYRAASAPRIGSKPLLYYYSFLNLAKAFLVIRKGMNLSHCMHGLREPDENVRKRLTITSQWVKVSDAGRRPHKRVQVYREFMDECGFPVPRTPKATKVVDLLEQVVAINRVTCHSLGRSPQFFPIDRIAFEYDPEGKKVWIAFRIDRGELAVRRHAPHELRKHTSRFDEVESPDPGYRRYESRAMGYGRSPMQVLRKLVLATWADIWSELRPAGYQFWASSVPGGKRMAQLASGYQTMFYLGSIARYRPDDFHNFAEGKHGWLLQEFINSQPLQFLYFLGSGIAETEMIMPELTTG